MRMKLADFLNQHDISPQAFAEQVGDVSASGVRKWKYGDRVPRADQMRRIVEITCGLVTPNDFILEEEVSSRLEPDHSTAVVVGDVHAPHHAETAAERHVNPASSSLPASPEAAR